MRGGVEPIHRSTSLLGRLPAVRSGRRDRLSSLLHPHRAAAECGCRSGEEPGRSCRAACLTCSSSLCTPSSMARLLRPGRCAWARAAHSVVPAPELAFGEPAGLAQRLVERLHDLPAPLLLHLLPSLLQLVTQGSRSATPLRPAVWPGGAALAGPTSLPAASVWRPFPPAGPGPASRPCFASADVIFGRPAPARLPGSRLWWRAAVPPGGACAVGRARPARSIPVVPAPAPSLPG